jgi:hypothetical protein
MRLSASCIGAVLLPALLAFPAQGAGAGTSAETFVELVQTADAHRARGHYAQAFRAYQHALELKDDPTIRGRVGVIAAKFGAPDSAANELLTAVQRGGGSMPAESAQFMSTFAQVRPQVCLLTRSVNVTDAIILLDGKRGYHRAGTKAWTFVLPGRHSIRASAEGYEDAYQEFDAPKGGEVTVDLELKRLAAASPNENPDAPPISLPQKMDVATKTTLEMTRRDSRPASAPDRPTVTPSAPAFSPHFGLGTGSFVSIHRTPDVTTGSFLSLSVRLPFSSFTAFFAAEGRGVLPIPQEVSGAGRTTSLYPSIWTVTLAPCGEYKIVFTCFVYETGVREFRGPDDVGVEVSDASSHHLGFRLGAEWISRSRYGIMGYIEGLYATNKYRIEVQEDLFWSSPRMVWGLNVGAIWSP